MRTVRRTALFIIAAAAAASGPAVAARDHVYLDLPITQTVNRDGVIRYGVWVKVGERSVQALLDTGSTGLRVLPPVLPDVFGSLRTSVTFGAGIKLDGEAVAVPVEIGSLRGVAPVQIIDGISCTKANPNCDVAKAADPDDFRIGGDGYPSQGYAAILGIGLPFRGGDLGNPLVALGVKRWIVELPRPFEEADGHLILDPDAAASRGFAPLDRHGSADADGCLKGGPMPQETCGSVLFDTGAPGIELASEEIETASRWDDGAAGTLRFTSNDRTFNLDFHAGESGGLMGVSSKPANPQDLQGPFILAGVAPYFTYDILYDAGTHTVGLRPRTLAPPMASTEKAETAARDNGPDDGR